MATGARASAAAMAKTRQLEDAWSNHVATEKRQELLNDFAAIVQELQSCPDKIPNCRKAVMSGMFLPKPQAPRNTDANSIPDCDKWCFKLPKHFFDSHGPAMFNITEATIALMIKADRQSLHKLLYKSTGWHSNTRVTVFGKDAIADKVRQQIALIGASVGEDIPVDGSGVVNWEIFSPYKLLPECPSEVEPEDHAFKRISVFGKFEAALPKWLTITGAWEWSNAWSLQDCVVKLPMPAVAGEKKRPSPSCHFYNECLANHKEFQTWFKTLPSTLGDATVSTTVAAASQGAASSSGASSAGGSTGAILETPAKKRPRAPALLGLASVRKQMKKLG
ncbi:unnamed protein product [Prorocentrum cordatum]|uniref:Uncharacterized protein n=1 Tax=Prorocentrum cordatum TaxID=2364126 RepID=A0ABN9VLH4_9DINO|nr:unnamed protein product [Polarella glacialis]